MAAHRKTSLIIITIIIIGVVNYWWLDSNSLTNNNTNDEDTKPDESEFWVVAYHPVYQWFSFKGDIPWNRLTHLILGYLHLRETGDGNYSLKTPNEFHGDLGLWLEYARDFITMGHAAGVKVNCMLGGAGSNLDMIWNRATGPDNITLFVNNIVTILKSIGFDGIDIDWEDSVDFSQLVKFAKEVRKKWPNAIITIPIDPTGIDAVDLAPAKYYVDAFMPMPYIPIQQWGGWLIPVPLTPLYCAERIGHGQNPYSVNLTLHRWLNAGVDSSKIVMGIGGHGSVWGDSNGDGIASIRPYSNSDLFGPAATEIKPIAGDNVVIWSWVRNITKSYPEFVEAWDDVGKCSYWHAPATDQLVTVKDIYGHDIKVGIIFYETPRSISEKVAFCNAHSMGGMMFWTLSEMIDGTSCPILEAISQQ